MAHLRKRDYFTRIREKDLDTILAQLGQTTAYSPTMVRQEQELKTIAVISANICHRYDVDKIFTDILPWSASTQFNIGELVEYKQPAYSDSSTYIVNDLVSFQTTANNIISDDIYINIIAITAPEVFNSSKWTKQEENAALYTVKEPVITSNPSAGFSYDTNLFTGNHDTIKGWDTTNDLFLKRIDNQVKIYYSTADRTNDVNSIGVVDVTDQIKEFPSNIPIESGDDLENSLSGTLFIIGFMPDNQLWGVVASNAYQKEDFRNRLIVDIMVDLVLFSLYGLGSQRFIPDFVGENRDTAMQMLKDIKKGTIAPKLPLHNDETRGQRIAFGSEPALNHTPFRTGRPWAN